MARNGIYGKAPYGQADADFCRLMAEILAWDMRRDVKATAVILAVGALTRTWSADHFSRKERARWSHKARAAFRASEAELAEATGASRARVHTATRAMLDAGFLVELAPLTRRGEGRGTMPATIALKCHLRDAKATNSSFVSDSVSGADARSHAGQGWNL